MRFLFLCIKVVIHILVPNQMIEVNWNNFSKKWYTDKGYIFTNKGDTFIVKGEDLHPGAKNKIKVICDYCGKEYLTNQFTHNKAMNEYPYKDCCSTCTGKKTSEVSYKRRQDEAWTALEKACQEKGYKLITNKNEFTDQHMKIQYICPQHGLQSNSLDPMIRKGVGCSLCKNEYVGKALSHDIDDVERLINSYNNNKLLNKEEYKDATIHNLNILCGLCGKNIFTTSYTNYRKAEVRSCFSCSNKSSKFEKRIKDFLNQHNITFIPEKRFIDCCDKRPLPFDFYLHIYNLIIEYDGKQHFEPVKIGGMSEEDAKKQFEITQKHDQIKNEYCKSHGIELLRIPYWEQDNIEQIITDKLNELDRRYSLVS